MDVVPTPIDLINITFNHRQDLGDLGALAQSIEKEGLLQPIGITPDRHLVFGKRRLFACKDILQWKEIPARVMDVTSLLSGQFAENELRKDFTPTERDSIRRALETEIQRRQGQRTDLMDAALPVTELVGNSPEAAENAELAAADTRGNSDGAGAQEISAELVANRPQVAGDADSAEVGVKAESVDPQSATASTSAGAKTRDVTSRAAGFKSTTEARRVRQVVDKGDPALVKAMDDGKISVSVAAELAKLSVAGQVKALEGGKEAIRTALAKARAKKQKKQRKCPASFNCQRETKKLLAMVHKTIAAWPAEHRPRLADALDELAAEARKSAPQGKRTGRREASQATGNKRRHRKQGLSASHRPASGKGSRPR